MLNLPVGARVNISPSALARSEPVAVARRWTACAKANDHRSEKQWDAFGETGRYLPRFNVATSSSDLCARP